MLRKSLTLMLRGGVLRSSLHRQLSTTNQLLKAEAVKGESEEEVDNEPIRYSTSDAARWKAEETFHPKTDAPPIQGPLVALSLCVFMMYFCVIREENDLDERLKQPLEYTVPNIEPSHQVLKIDE